MLNVKKKHLKDFLKMECIIFVLKYHGLTVCFWYGVNHACISLPDVCKGMQTSPSPPTTKFWMAETKLPRECHQNMSMYTNNTYGPWYCRDVNCEHQKEMT